ncbi:HAMP domain-containing histidine kinase [Corallococcus exiguus]|uniref:sensor histidine kinase n=1 Tax=Corallococcus exiguus TaxID=83462 RepID=UPI001A8F4332|nr:HAMP domain-containing sensor histidine kinase [Corallococcus exiguus]MBN8467624.1 HAMP domain-containing histidine kinase [Corallococcus exiguus]
MPTPRPAGTEVSWKLLFLAFAAVVGSFFVTTVIVQRSSGVISDLSNEIIYNSAPSIEHLALVRRAVLEVELVLARFINEPTHRGELDPELETALSDARAGIREYLDLTALPGEQAVRRDVQESWLRFEAAVTQARTDAASMREGAEGTLFEQEVEPPARHLLENITRSIEWNAVRGRELAERIREARSEAVWLSTSLHVVCGILAGVVAWLLHRELQGRRALADAHTKFVEARAEELEQFAGRVAHDIRNPLSSARMAAELGLRKSPDESSRAPFKRVIRSLSRADAITGALLDFARSGARPDPGARAEPRAIITDLLGGFAAETEQAGIELRHEPVPPVLVACSTGVYLSLLGNLIRNAIKYMGEATTRRVTLRVEDTGAFLRTSVSDTGPGITPELLPSLFEPYFRVKGSSAIAEGLGLGLATVKKLVEGHGGRVGVTSTRGKGSTFWFELPRAGTSSWEAPPPPHDAPGTSPLN